MAQSRQAFLASMGISEDDMHVPGAKSESTMDYSRAAARPSSRSTPKPSAAGCTKERVIPTKGESKPHRAAPLSPGASEKRAQFLREMGIDNAAAAGPDSAAAAGTARRAMEATRTPEPETPSPTRGVAAHSFVPQLQSDVVLSRGSNLAAPDTKIRCEAVSREAPSGTASELKEMGNKHFEAKDFRKAVRMYTYAIEKDSTNAAYYSNRSAAYLLGGKQMGIDTRNMALRDADKTIELKPTWFKGYSRRGDALFKLERFLDAEGAYCDALKYDPDNEAVQSSLHECREFARRGGIARPIPQEVLKERSGRTSAVEMYSRFMDEAGQHGVKKDADMFRIEQLKKFRDSKNEMSSSMVMPENASLNSTGTPQSSSTTPNSTMDSRNEFLASFNGHSSSSTPMSGSMCGGLGSIHIPEECSSTAATQYQNRLLEEYRKKKMMKKNAH